MSVNFFTIRRIQLAASPLVRVFGKGSINGDRSPSPRSGSKMSASGRPELPGPSRQPDSRTWSASPCTVPSPSCEAKATVPELPISNGSSSDLRGWPRKSLGQHKIEGCRAAEAPEAAGQGASSRSAKTTAAANEPLPPATAAGCHAWIVAPVIRAYGAGKWPHTPATA